MRQGKTDDQAYFGYPGFNRLVKTGGRKATQKKEHRGKSGERGGLSVDVTAINSEIEL